MADGESDYLAVLDDDAKIDPVSRWAWLYRGCRRARPG
jgi:hypothetical protein